MSKLKGTLIWLRWKLFYPKDGSTVVFLSGRMDVKEEYWHFLLDQGYSVAGEIMLGKRNTEKKCKQIRRDLMWRFFVKGER
jgi:hypothetical protein